MSIGNGNETSLLLAWCRGQLVPQGMDCLLTLSQSTCSIDQDNMYIINAPLLLWKTLSFTEGQDVSLKTHHSSLKHMFCIVHDWMHVVWDYIPYEQ
jgi:hypothetical protein